MPISLSVDQNPVSKKVTREVNLLSILCILSLIAVFVATFIFSQNRFTPETRSLNLHPSLLLIFVWGAISGFLYYEFDLKKMVYFLLPGIIVGGGCFLGLISFVAELAFPKVIFHANLGAVSTIFVTHVLNYFRVLDRYPSLESKLVFAGSVIMSLVIGFITYLVAVSFFINTPENVENPLGFYWNTIGICLVVITLMSFLSLFHLHEIEKFCSEDDSFEEKLNLAANSLFIVFMMYLFFLGFFAVLRKGK